MPLLNSVIKWINIKRNYQIQYYRDHPHEIQNETLLSLLNNAENTVWGKKYDYSKISSVEDFKKSLDTVTHEEIMQFVLMYFYGKKTLFIRFYVSRFNATYSSSSLSLTMQI